ncbi:hypothetical protein HGI30_02245 [Paenibacillus albicereus]|uniref:Uncharacterized protein n=1 Tax=Paenibacillus albicereus TaxID=2726185 RepID=A0A6H2GTP9_9BACL|nr:hypothetical protein [Paenibacillus albicereus]QJC50528.1 hypothetical protein HGI30_02245 [Paenibacillus albicereus]
MKKSKLKAFAVSAAALALIVSAQPAFAASSVSGSAGGAWTSGSVSIGSSSGSASTSSGSSSAYVSVEVVYRYYAGLTTTPYPVTKSASGYQPGVSATANSAHQPVRSIDARGTHYVKVGTGTWTDTTFTTS